IAAADFGETADVAEHLREEVRPLPGCREGTNPAGTNSADGTTRSIVTQFHALPHFGQQFLLQETGILIGKRVVLETAVGAALPFARERARIDEDAHRDGHFLLMN